MAHDPEFDADLQRPLPNDQQEDEGDITGPVSFRDAIVISADWTIETIFLQIQKGNIDLEPKFQRRVAWDDVRRSRLIESIVVGMPVPNIVIAENKNQRNRFIVIDGKQRLAAICDFMQDSLELSGLDVREDLNKKKFSQFSKEDQATFENSTIRASMIRNWRDDNFLYAIFYRLNSGSLPLSPQELRKALIGGKLLSLIESYISSSKPFQEIFGAGLDKRMRDSELVLRFIAFDRGLEEYRGDFRKFLDNYTRYFEEEGDGREREANDSLSRLDAALAESFRIFKESAFKKWIGFRYERVINRAIFDCMTRFFADQTVRNYAVGKEKEIVNEFHLLCDDPIFRDAIEKTTKSLGATYRRIDMWGEALSSVLQLKYDHNKRRIVER
ncbi:DUF262 domain-containing protein [Pseudoroseomonas cervicalis]|uniref:DUF262 domain-containing protein n=1 Tax=Teichococcus cervicalis TaxID=204525 RepID=UPI0022F18825|nr:DUF262 domain-containing protein [Pseudoroseomonas cervicalis]WBV41879.1 DUF262 domain-containing protein [Pseudoroseomonas cervicalis]